jgi:hypothetical protein
LATDAVRNVMTLASLSLTTQDCTAHNAEPRFPVPRLPGFASIVCLGHLSAEGVNNSMTPGPDWHGA